MDSDSSAAPSTRGPHRPLIVVCGRVAVGKTTASVFVRRVMSDRGIPHEPAAISIAQSMLSYLRQDETSGGLHHVHPWCANSHGHVHAHGEPEFPFTLTDNVLHDLTDTHFFTRLQAACPDQHQIVEWTASANTLRAPHPHALIDPSFARRAEKLLNGSLPSEWLQRAVVVHVTAPEELRVRFSSNRGIPTDSDIAASTKSWSTSEVLLQVFGRDDFESMGELLNRAGTPVYRVVNDGTSAYFTRLDRVVTSILENSVNGQPF